MFILSLSISCEQDISDEDCDTYGYADCNTEEPFEAELKLNFTINSNNKRVPFQIIDGRVDNGKIIVYDTAETSEIVYVMALPYYYSVKATYKSGDKTIFAIDGVNMKANSIEKCDSVCWNLPTFRLDLTLQ